MPSKEFVRLMNRLDKLEEKMASFQHELKKIRNDLNLAAINGELEYDQRWRVLKE